MYKILIGLVVVVVLGVGAYFMYKSSFQQVATEDTGEEMVEEEEQEPAPPSMGEPVSIGTSVEGRDIVAHSFGQGEAELLFVGGIHGGYSWNTVLVAYELVDYLKANPTAVPANERVTVVPVLNPDGLFEVVGSAGRFSPSEVSTSQTQQIAGRFNANNVDLNRNFDCDWQAEGVWQSRSVSGGIEPFSEPESQAIKNYIEANNPAAVVVWYSAAGGVYASDCHSGVLPETNTLTDLYADASGYPAYQSFDFYAITGDMVNWLAKDGIPAISVLLTDHEDPEWDKNKAGIEALIAHYAE